MDSFDTILNFPLIMGLLAATIHVFTGPDHLAAVTPLVFDTQKKHWKIGFSWGIGHILGMLMIGVLFYFFKDLIDVESFSKYSEKFVGFILIGLGIWAFYRIKHKKHSHKHPHIHRQNQSEILVHIHKHEHTDDAHTHRHEEVQSSNLYTAVGVGTIHGFAGIAHFLLFLPVLGFKTKQASVLYMLGFSIGIVFSMLSYTFVIGKLQNKSSADSFLRNFQFWSGILAIAVGVYWIFVN